MAVTEADADPSVDRSSGPIHGLHRDLLELGLCRPGSLEPFHSTTRDRDDVAVLRCRDSGVILLSRTDHLDSAYYHEKRHQELAALGDIDRVVKAHDEDTRRRADQWRTLVTNRRWVDVGTGAGAILDELGPLALSTAAVEPQGEFNAELRARGHDVARDVRELPALGFDVATSFHVFEHLTDPISDLRALSESIVPGGRIVIEVPHAHDALLSFFDVDAFRSFTLWSEHLVLHTRESLRRFVEAAGFVDVRVSGYQRYPLANHLHWLKEGRPGGHEQWSVLRDEGLEASYAAVLSRLDLTDTLIAEARRPG